MIIVFFIYGLAFFSLGLAIIFQSKKQSSFKIASCFWLLAWFGILHGINEWLDMFLILGEGHWNAQAIKAVEITRFLVGKISYLFLLQFGLASILINHASYRWIKPVSLSAYIILIICLFAYGCKSDFNLTWFSRSDIFMRYFLAFPAALLASLGFFRQNKSSDIKKLNS
ncbi:MAG: hypothetical protein ABIA63_01830, partial [bacterium]